MVFRDYLIITEVLIGEKKIYVVNKKIVPLPVSLSDIQLSFIYLQRWKKGRPIFRVFYRKQGYHGTYLGKENESIKLQTLAYIVKLSRLLL